MQFDDLLKKIYKEEVKPEFIPLTDVPYSETLSDVGRRVPFGPGMSFVIGGMTGAGKSSYSIHMFVLSIYEYWLRHPDEFSPVWVIRSLERPKTYTMGKMLCTKIYMDTGILLDVPTLFQMPNKKRILTDEDMRLIDSYAEYFNKMYERVRIIDGPTTPAQMHEHNMDMLLQMGTYIEADAFGVRFNNGEWEDFHPDDYDLVEGLKLYYMDTDWGRIYQNEKKYFPDNEKQLVIHMVDHINKLQDNGSGERKTIDEHAKHTSFYKDVCGWVTIDIQQLNTDIEDNPRLKKKTIMNVQASDFRGSQVPAHDSDVLIALFSPHKLGLQVCGNYNMRNCMGKNGENRFRLLKIIKNNLGADEFMVGLFFLGECGFVRELPADNQMNDTHYNMIQEGTYGNAKALTKVQRGRNNDDELNLFDD